MTQDRCGPVPSDDWDPRTHGPHFCITAPGTVRGLIPDRKVAPGRGRVSRAVIGGTSFAAPGCIRSAGPNDGTLPGNTREHSKSSNACSTPPTEQETYADLETYGAGHLDLEAALSPVGSPQHRDNQDDTHSAIPASHYLPRLDRSAPRWKASKSRHSTSRSSRSGCQCRGSYP